MSTGQSTSWSVGGATSLGNNQVPDGGQLGLTDAGHVEKVLDGIEPPVGVPVGHDPVCQYRTHPGEGLQFGGCGPVERDRPTTATGNASCSRHHRSVRAGHDDVISRSERSGQIDSICLSLGTKPTGGLDRVSDYRTRRNVDDTWCRHQPRNVNCIGLNDLDFWFSPADGVRRGRRRGWWRDGHGTEQPSHRKCDHGEGCHDDDLSPRLTHVPIPTVPEDRLEPLCRSGTIASVDIERRRQTVRGILRSALAAIDPETLTGSAIGRTDQPRTVIAIGKAAPAMCRGAAQVLANVSGICVASTRNAVPNGISLLVGEHPEPGDGSFRAGESVLKAATHSAHPIVALISGGGSSLCELPIEGVTPGYLTAVNRQLLRSGASITDMNLVRRHLSAIKGGGLAAAANAPIETFAISDVSGADPSVIASGPTIPQDPSADDAIATMISLGIEVPDGVRDAIRRPRAKLENPGPVTVIADGKTAAAAVAQEARSAGIPVRSEEQWLEGDLSTTMQQFLDGAEPGINVGAGEVSVEVSGSGVGGRNTHAALLAASLLAGTGSVFCAFATDGVDGISGSAGAIVDGDTVDRGGDPGPALANSDSATYLRRTGDLIETGPTGTNVSDLWILWR